MSMTRFQQQANRVGQRAGHWTVLRLLEALLREIGEDDVPGMAAEMAYHFLFAIFPLLLFLVAALGFVGNALGFDHVFNRIVGEASLFLPGSASAILDQYATSLLNTKSSTFLTVGLVGTIWGAAGGTGALMKGLNRAYDVTTLRPFWQRQAIALVGTMVIPTVGLFLFVLEVLGHGVAVWIVNQVGLAQSFVEVLPLLRWPVLVLLLFLGHTALYYWLPNTHLRYVWSLPGSLFATIGWLGLSGAFGFYVARFGHFDVTYGSFGAAMAFLLWLYLIGIVILLGAELNSLLEPVERQTWQESKRLDDRDDTLDAD